MCVGDAVCLSCNLSTLVSYLSLKFGGPWGAEAYVRDSKLSPIGAPTSVPPSLGEMVWVEVSRAALKEGPMSGVSMQEKMMEAPIPVEAAGANMTPCIDGGCANEVEN
jgi:hypothetical protein